MGFIRIVLTEYGSYFIAFYLSILFGLYLLNICLNANLIIIFILFAAEGIILNQIVSVSGLPSQLIVRGHNLSIIWKYTNTIILVALNIVYLSTTILYEISSTIWYGLFELNYFLIPILAIGNKISNTKIAYYYKIFNIPLLRYFIFTLAISMLLFTNLIIESFAFEVSVLIISFWFLIYSYTTENSLRNPHLLYDIDRHHYD